MPHALVTSQVPLGQHQPAPRQGDDSPAWMPEGPGGEGAIPIGDRPAWKAAGHGGGLQGGFPEWMAAGDAEGSARQRAGEQAAWRGGGHAQGDTGYAYMCEGDIAADPAGSSAPSVGQPCRLCITRGC